MGRRWSEANNHLTCITWHHTDAPYSFSASDSNGDEPFIKTFGSLLNCSGGILTIGQTRYRIHVKERHIVSAAEDLSENNEDNNNDSVRRNQPNGKLCRFFGIFVLKWCCLEYVRKWFLRIQSILWCAFKCCFEYHTEVHRQKKCQKKLNAFPALYSPIRWPRHVSILQHKVGKHPTAKHSYVRGSFISSKRSLGHTE